jgi:ROK family
MTTAAFAFFVAVRLTTVSPGGSLPRREAAVGGPGRRIDPPRSASPGGPRSGRCDLPAAPVEGPVAFVNVSDGVGVGIAVDGKLLRGAHNTAGEFGHVPLNMYGPRCSCGQRGCTVPLGEHPRLRGAAALISTPAFAAPVVS